MAGAKTSKTARASMPTKGGAKYEVSTEVARVIPTGGGDYAYVLDLTGKSIRTTVGSDIFFETMRSLAGTGAVRATSAVLRDCAAKFANPGWAIGLRLIEGLEETEAAEELVGEA